MDKMAKKYNKIKSLALNPKVMSPTIPKTHYYTKKQTQNPKS